MVVDELNDNNVNDLKATTYNFNLAAISYFYGLCFEKEFNKKLLPKANSVSLLFVLAVIYL